MRHTERPEGAEGARRSSRASRSAASGTPTPSERDQRRVAAFDFDGTLTERDTLVPFLRIVAGTGALSLAVLRNLPTLLAAAAADGRRDAAKVAMFRRLLRGRDERKLRDEGARYADAIV